MYDRIGRWVTDATLYVLVKPSYRMPKEILVDAAHLFDLVLKNQNLPVHNNTDSGKNSSFGACVPKRGHSGKIIVYCNIVKEDRHIIQSAVSAIVGRRNVEVILGEEWMWYAPADYVSGIFMPPSKPPQEEPHMRIAPQFICKGTSEAITRIANAGLKAFGADSAEGKLANKILADLHSHSAAQAIR